MARPLIASLIAAIALGMIAVAFPSEALACPNCVIRENTPGRMFLLVSMILLPWTVVGVVVFAIRKTLSSEPRE